MRRIPWGAVVFVVAALVVGRVARQMTRTRTGRLGAAASLHAERQARAGAQVMGTVLEVTVEAPDRETARRLATRAVRVAHHWDDVLTTWRPQGELARLNAAAGNGAVRVSADLASALARMRALSDATSGAFDPGVGALVTWWRMPAAQRAGREPPAGPWGMAQVLREEGGAYRLHAGAQIDSGAIGKGIALDAMARAVRDGGATAAFFDFGGSSQLASGRLGAPAGEPEVAIAGLAPGELHGTVLLRNAGLSTSRSSRPGAPAGSIVDPRSGEPVLAPRLATVLAADATTAEAWSTALVVLGRSGIEAARSAGVQVLFEDDRGLVVTPAFPLVRAGA